MLDITQEMIPAEVVEELGSLIVGASNLFVRNCSCSHVSKPRPIMMTCCCCCGHNQLQRLAARVTVATAQGAFDRHAALANFELESRQQFLATLNAFEDKSVCNIHSNL